MYRQGTSYGTLVLVFSLLFLTMTGGIAYYLTIPVSTEHFETEEKTAEIFDDDFTVDEDDYKKIEFTLNKGVDCVVSWEWDLKDSDLEINFYLMTEDDFELWNDDEDFDYIHRIKRNNDGEGENTLDDGVYCFIFNNADEGEEVEVEFEASYKWEVTITVTGSRTRHELHFPVIVSSLVTTVCVATYFGIKYQDPLYSFLERLTERIFPRRKREQRSRVF